jgi:uncharacterized DUF497 family protein
MKIRLEWDEPKRLANLDKHGLDFGNAYLVLESRYRMDIAVVRNGEPRTMSFSYVMNWLAVLTVIHLDREGTVRIVSFRQASEIETEAYYEWLGQEDD